MIVPEKVVDVIKRLMSAAVAVPLTTEDYRAACEAMDVVKLYYDMDLGDSGRYRDPTTQKLVLDGTENTDRKIVLYDSGEKPGATVMFTYYYEGNEFVHAYIDMREGIEEKDVDRELYPLVADVVCVLASRDNMRRMLDFAEMTDAQSGIPNVMHISKKYGEVLRSRRAEEYTVICFNIQNFKYLNETASSRCGDEAIVQYAHIVASIMQPDECICRMGGDNFAAYIKRDRLDEIINTLHSITLTKLENAPGRSFEVSAWIGVSQGQPGDMRPFSARLGEASMACNIGKTRLKQSVVFYSEELKMMMNRGREIMAMFFPAIKNREFCPFFQAKVNMQTGELVGFEALCRWIHDGRFIYPDQFIPILDKEGLIHELDMAIFRETCIKIKEWKDMGLKPPRISSNFSRKNLFVPNIEEMIYNTIKENGIGIEDVEIEITESVQEAETNRLIEFVRKMKEYGLHISIDDFGTGYSSLMLIHNIDADVIKIDKSFVDEISTSRKSLVLIESIIGIAKNLDMEVIAEGVETAEQGRELMRLGCVNAQGYYYSKPVDFDAATELIRTKPFSPIES